MCVSVRDTGIGFAPEEGEGIGLSVSRSIVERHRGHLWATTHNGPGATFAFALPPAVDTKVSWPNG